MCFVTAICGQEKLMVLMKKSISFGANNNYVYEQAVSLLNQKSIFRLLKNMEDEK